ncbi:hypothetical protein SY83_20660 [Paenibacillus swuensis]|uniref:DUF2164 domain-containing protein n=1 Tax=Paenibacillus swuensis TaxID=1178515 RepID=A0A172TMP3_9BACL|nr:DUF2164 domain-containing protein [Paenibacillus swuensis]ANE48298.1 hypothetical protein SY83_20660 [Paenibacillus swuensis]
MVTKLPKETKQQMVSNLQIYVQEQWNQEIGQLPAELLLDFVLKELTPHVYNQAIDDASGLMSDRMTAMEEDLYALKKQIQLAKRTQ